MKLLNNLKNGKAFTLIEVVIVIAIGALIILVVLQAVSNAQQSQRDSSRRQEGSQITAAMEQYFANNNEYPDDPDSSVLQAGYVSDTIETNWSDNGTMTLSAPSAGECSDIGAVDFDSYYEVDANNRDYTFWICLEQGDDPVEIRPEDEA